MKNFASILATLTLTVSCSQIPKRGPASEPFEERPEQVDVRVTNQEVRRAAIQKATLIDTTREIESADILAGPRDWFPKKNELRYGDLVRCTHIASTMGGATPKFTCVITQIIRQEAGQFTAFLAPEATQAEKDEVVQKYGPNIKFDLLRTKDGKLARDRVKVKFVPNTEPNREVNAEAAATRLFWALGFHADVIFPVRLFCDHCPAIPQSGRPDYQAHGQDMGWVAIERKIPGETLETKPDEGWSWKELDELNGNSLAVKDALKLLAAFVGHGDNKPEQQRLMCKQDAMTVTEAVEKNKKIVWVHECREPYMVVQDIGATFGGAGKTTDPITAKMNLKHWRNDPRKTIWKDRGSCQARLTKSMKAKDGVGDPVISEEGRLFLASRLCRLSDKQIEDIFRVARVEDLKGEGKIADWVAVFKAKRDEIVANDCKTSNGEKLPQPLRSCEAILAADRAQ
ncbi:MAG TPA: hypothetical protein VFV50_11685 [Bdellovibrionales bacterium]|nr:hypothetical protein [Bdellovibrionales bacterium]